MADGPGPRGSSLPAAHAYINRHFPLAQRPLGLSIYTLCLLLGSMVGFVIGGIAGEQLGGRTTFALTGATGLLVAIVTCYALPSPVQTEAASQAKGEPPASLAALLQKRSLILTLTGSAFISMGGYTELTFTPAFLMRSHALSLSEAGLGFGVLISAES